MTVVVFAAVHGAPALLGAERGCLSKVPNHLRVQGSGVEWNGVAVADPWRWAWGGQLWTTVAVCTHEPGSALVLACVVFHKCSELGTNILQYRKNFKRTKTKKTETELT